MTMQLDMFVPTHFGTERVAEKDITRRKHSGNPESIAAHASLAPHIARQRADVLLAVINAGVGGITCKELAERWGCGQNCISGRFTELALAGRIKRSGVRRAGAAVWRVH